MKNWRWYHWQEKRKNIASGKDITYAKNNLKGNDDKYYENVCDHCHNTDKYRGTKHNISNLEYKTPKGIPVILHNGSNYDYHFIIRYLPAEEFKGQFE